MYNNSASKLRSIIIVITFLEIVGCVITAIALVANEHSIGFVFLLVAVIIWVSNLFIMAILEACEDIHIIRCNMFLKPGVPQGIISGSAVQSPSGAANSTSTWICQSCGASHPSWDEFCDQCGARKNTNAGGKRIPSLPTGKDFPETEKWICPECNQSNKMKDIFCKNCGKKR